MKLRTKYIAFVGLVHSALLMMSYFVFSESKLIFLVSELVLLVSVIIAWNLYASLIRPLTLLMQGADAMRDKDFTVKLAATGQYELDQLIDVYNTMMDALRTERTRQEMQHYFLEKLIRSSPTGILILDFDENIQQVNPKALELLGMQEQDILRKSAAGFSHPLLQQVGLLRPGQAKTVAVNGASTYKLQKSHFIDRGFARHFVVMEDMTAEILAAEKKTYGKVIRMMAHEVNNTIGPVNSIMQTTLQSQQHPDMIARALQVAIERNESLNQFMRNFAGLVQIPAPAKRPVDMQVLLQHAAELLQFRAGEKNVRIVYELAPLVVMADAQQMEQVAINVIKNAIEAIGCEGAITLITRPHPGQLVIRDTGRGIAPGSEQQLFSPFYSTRKDGQGIGLMVVREILLNHGFAFSLKTIEEGRTEFEISFE